MIGWTLCSGIGAAETAAPWIDWKLASEIEPFPRSVLMQRFGHKPVGEWRLGDPMLWSDMAEIDVGSIADLGIPLPDIIAAGTPCQSFSVAGLRNGLADDRGNLTLEFVRIIHDIVAARPDGRLTVLWENVPGVLSDKGNAFGAFLGGLVGADDALPNPVRGSWPGVGMVAGPRARVAWRVFDAQHFGVPQRRRRVFLVADFGNAADPAKILFERKSGQGNPAPREEAGQTAPTIPSRSTAGGGLGTDFDCDGGLIPSIAWALQERDHKGADSDTKIGHLLPWNDQITHALRGEGFDASEDGTGRGTPIVPVGVALRGREGGGTAELTGEISPALRASQGGGDKPHVPAFSSKDFGADAMMDISPTLRAGGHAQSHANAGVPPAVAFAENQRGEMGHPAAMNGFAVRRLTPTECHRLQGFDDTHCAVMHRNKPAADGPQYKAIGNSWAVPVAVWILNRLKQEISEYV